MTLENLYTPNCIRTFTGIYMNVFEPTSEMICIEDIAHSLSMQPRFGGHLPIFYSVAEHSINCARLVPDNLKLEALLHDASEAYLMDLPRPIKNNMPQYKEIEENLMKLIFDKFGLIYPLHEKVKLQDEIMLQYEWESLMLSQKQFPFIRLSNNNAKYNFLQEFKWYLYINKNYETFSFNRP